MISGTFQLYKGCYMSNSTDLLQAAAFAYRRLMRKKYVFTFNNGKHATLVFKPAQFAHLAGLRYFSDIAEFKKERSTAASIFARILKGSLTIDDAKASAFYDFSAEERLISVCRIQEILSTDRAVYDFNPRIANSRIKSHIIFFKVDEALYLILGTYPDNENIYYPITCFLCYDDMYIRGQNIVRIAAMKTLDLE